MDETQKPNSKLISVGVIVVIICAALIGYVVGTKNPETIVIEGVDNVENGVIANKDFSIFWDTWRTIQNSYLNADDVSTQELIYGSSSGLVGALKDPYSAFLTPGESKKFSEDINGNFGGIGAEIGMKNDQLIIVAPLKNSPAERAGLISGDKILEINASSTISISINDAVKMIRGPKGTSVTLTISRSGKDKPLKIPIMRDTITVPTTELTLKDNNKIAHLQLFTFSEQAPLLLAQHILNLKKSDIKGIVLDLRNNPGGYLDAAVQIAGFFTEPNMPIVYEEFRTGRKETFVATSNPIAKDIPLVVLLNNGSASASEILAGALRDNRGVKIIGEKSFGKGSVQELTQLHDGSVVKLTIAHWILPKGAQIDKKGIEPDFEVKLTDEDREKKRDPQLEKALEVLRTLIPKT